METRQSHCKATDRQLHPRLTFYEGTGQRIHVRNLEGAQIALREMIENGLNWPAPKTPRNTMCRQGRHHRTPGYIVNDVRKPIVDGRNVIRQWFLRCNNGIVTCFIWFLSLSLKRVQLLLFRNQHSFVVHLDRDQQEHLGRNIHAGCKQRQLRQ